MCVGGVCTPVCVVRVCYVFVWGVCVVCDCGGVHAVCAGGGGVHAVCVCGVCVCVECVCVCVCVCVSVCVWCAHSVCGCLGVFTP